MTALFADRSRIIVSRHARNRLKERFFLQFHISYFYTENLTDSLIIELAKNAKEVMWWKLNPFYLNKVTSKYGPTVVLEAKKNLNLLCTPMEGGKLMVRTIVKSFNPRV